MGVKRAIAVESFDKTKLTFYFDDKNHSSEGRICDVGNGENHPWNDNVEDGHSENYLLRVVEFDKSFAKYDDLKFMYDYFCDCYALEKINGLENLNTEHVEDMSYMFCGCRNLKEIRSIENFNTENVMDMEGMFWDCRALKSLDLSKWDTGYLESCAEMFKGIPTLDNLNLSGWDIRCLYNADDMFVNSSIKSLDLSGWDSSYIESFEDLCNFQYIFGDTEDWKNTNITFLNLSGWDEWMLKKINFVVPNTVVCDMSLIECDVLKEQFELADCKFDEEVINKICPNFVDSAKANLEQSVENAEHGNKRYASKKVEER